MTQPTSAQDQVLYTAQATATGGRTGQVQSDDQRLSLQLSVPAAIGGDDGPGTNPEQLFAAGYAACFQNALGVVGRRLKLDTAQSEVTARVGLKKAGLSYVLDTELHIRIPGIARSDAEAAVQAAHEVCPFSVATKGGMKVRLIVLD